MIFVAEHSRPEVAAELYELQQASYAVERDLIEYPDFPPLRVTADQIRDTQEVFLACRRHGRMAGATSYSIEDGTLDICRMLVHPDFFRQGIAAALLRAVEERAPAGVRITVSTAEKNGPAVQLYLKHGYTLEKKTVLPDGLVLVHFCKRMP